jgi:MerR family transcriptional regulator, light-induced transcriptional regulator
VNAVGSELGARENAYLEALLSHSSRGARQVIEEALAEGVAVEDLYLGVLTPALRAVGHQWAMGEVNVAEEHFATAVSHQLLDELSARMKVPPTDGRLAIVTGTPGELHALGARMVADFLQADGWEVLQLGASTPAADLAELVDHERPDLVGLSTTTAGALPGIADALEQLGGLTPRPLIAVGGQFWTAETSHVGRELGADIVAQDPRVLVALLRDRVPPRDG